MTAVLRNGRNRRPGRPPQTAALPRKAVSAVLVLHAPVEVQALLRPYEGGPKKFSFATRRFMAVPNGLEVNDWIRVLAPSRERRKKRSNSPTARRPARTAAAQRRTQHPRMPACSRRASRRSSLSPDSALALGGARMSIATANPCSARRRTASGPVPLRRAAIRPRVEEVLCSRRKQSAGPNASVPEPFDKERGPALV